MWLFIAQAFAGEVERLEGVHLGIGAGLSTTGTIGYTAAAYADFVSAPSASVSARIRLNPAFTVEPLLSASYARAADETEGDVTDSSQQTRLAAGIRLRPRIAKAGNADLAVLVGGDYAVEQAFDYDADGKEVLGGVANAVDANLGLGIELWLLPRLSLGADLESSVIEWTHEESRPEEGDKAITETLAVGLEPRARLVVAFYL